MDIVIDWESISWEECESESPGYRDKKCVREGQVVWLCDISEGYNREGDWCTERHLFYVVAGEATVRFRNGDKAVRLRAGDAGIVPAGEAYAHRVESAAGESIRLLLFEQP